MAEGTHPDWAVEAVVVGHRQFVHETSDGPIPIPVCAAPLAVTGVGVIVALYDGRISLFDPELEHCRWSVRTNSPVYASVVGLPLSRTAIIADQKGRVLAVDFEGSVLWQAEIGAPVYATPVADPTESVLYLSVFGGELVAIELKSGSCLFRKQLPVPWFHELSPLMAARNPYPGPVLAGEDRMASSSGSTISIHDNTGKIIWSRDLGAHLRATPAFDAKRKTLIVFAVDGRWHLLGAENGRSIQSGRLEDKVTASPALSDGVAIIGTASGQVFGLDLEEARIAWSATHGAPFDHSGFSAASDRAVICTNLRGNITARNPSNGQFLWETSQAIGQTGYGTRLDSTPSASADGWIYAGGYNGGFYSFRVPVEMA